MIGAPPQNWDGWPGAAWSIGCGAEPGETDATSSLLYLGDCLEIMRTLPERSIDAVVTDPPYGLGFMGKAWDHAVPGIEFWAEMLRVCKPGAHVVAFGGTRLYHRQVCAIEDAGFEVRDCLMWLYGSGFPKGHDVSKAIDDAAGAEREVVGPRRLPNGRPHEYNVGFGEGDGYKSQPSACSVTAPATEEAKRWAGWNTALKPAWEPITLARAPLGGTVAACVTAHGTGAINVDGCRVEMSDADADAIRNMGGFGRSEYERTPGEALNLNKNPMPCRDADPHAAGRWPANVLLDAEAGAAIDRVNPNEAPARYFYCPKAHASDRDSGLGHKAPEPGASYELRNGSMDGRAQPMRRNLHPTVKPVDLMRYLCRLVTPPGGIVLDPFMGSGSTGKAARREGFRFVGIERAADSHATACARVAAALAPDPVIASERPDSDQPGLFGDPPGVIA